MLKKLRHQFILSAMLAYTLVAVVLITAINLVNANEMKRGQVRQIRSILNYEQQDRVGKERPPIDEMQRPDERGREFTSRFFIVRCDADGTVRDVGRDFIFSVDAETAGAYVQSVLSRGKESGRYGDYRYQISSDEDGTLIVFLNISESAQHQRTFLIVSLLIGACSLIGVFALVMPLSKKAMRPYQKNLEMQKRFITDAGHELKTPITSIATSADIAAMEHEGDEWIQNIQSQTVRLSRLVSDLVTLSRLDEELPFPSPSRFSLSELCLDTVESFQPRAKAEEKTLSADIAEGLELLGDGTSIQKLLTILLDNALKYSPAGGEIRFCLKKAQNRLAVEVSNTCTQDLSLDAGHLFDRFYRPDASRSTATGGTGLGLSIAKAIAENHNGEISVDTAKKGRVTFRVLL